MDIYQVAQALNTVLTSSKQLAKTRRSRAMIVFEFVRNQPAHVCHRHEGLVQLLEVDFLAILEGLDKSIESDCLQPPMGRKNPPLSQPQWPPPGITVTTVTLPPLSLTHTTPLARNKTTNDTMTMALRTPYIHYDHFDALQTPTFHRPHPEASLPSG